MSGLRGRVSWGEVGVAPVAAGCRERCLARLRQHTRTARRWEIGQGFPPACSVSRETADGQHDPRGPAAGADALERAVSPGGPTRRMLGQAGIGSAAKRTHDCARPVRLRGSTRLVNRGHRRGPHGLLLGPGAGRVSWVPCGNRRAAVCAPCSATLQGRRLAADHHRAGRRQGHPGHGGRASVHVRDVDRAVVRAGARAPAEGAVPGSPRQAGLPARAAAVVQQAPPRRATRSSGEPLCVDCYDYTAHVVWQWHAPELWRRFTIALQRDLARRVGLTVRRSGSRCKISYSKVVGVPGPRRRSTCTSRSASTDPDGPDGTRTRPWR